MMIDMPDRFLHLTATAWTAISSFVSAMSVLALIAFNWRYLHWTHKLSNSAAEQATVAKDSLRRLEEQINSNLAAERHTAIAILRDAQTRVVTSAGNFRTEVRSDQNPLRLVPDDWSVLVTYVSHHLPDSFSAVSAASVGLHNVELELNRLTTVPTSNRGPNSSLRVRFDGLATNLDNIRKQLNDINAALCKGAPEMILERVPR
jgi:hypothetical protein